MSECQTFQLKTKRKNSIINSIIYYFISIIKYNKIHIFLNENLKAIDIAT